MPLKYMIISKVLFIIYQGNYVGLTEADMDKMDPKELEAKVEKARKILKDCGAHFIIDTIKDLPQVIDKINERMALGLSP